MGDVIIQSVETLKSLLLSRFGEDVPTYNRHLALLERIIALAELLVRPVNGNPVGFLVDSSSQQKDVESVVVPSVDLCAVALSNRGPNYSRNKAAKERRKRSKEVKKAVVVDTVDDELAVTLRERRIAENKAAVYAAERKMLTDKAFVNNVNEDAQYFARSFAKYEKENEAAMTWAESNVAKATVHAASMPMYAKAHRAGFAKTIVSSISSGVVSAASSLNPDDSISNAESNEEVFALKRELKDLTGNFYNLEAECVKLKKDLAGSREALRIKEKEWEEKEYKRNNKYDKPRKLYADSRFF